MKNEDTVVEMYIDTIIASELHIFTFQSYCKTVKGQA